MGEVKLPAEFKKHVKNAIVDVLCEKGWAPRVQKNAAWRQGVKEFLGDTYTEKLFSSGGMSADKERAHWEGVINAQEHEIFKNLL